MAAKKKASKPKPTPSQAEIDYGTGARERPPMLHEMSDTSQQVLRDNYRSTMSGWQTKVKRAKRAKNKDAVDFTPSQIAALTNSNVGIEEAGENLASVWDQMIDRSIDDPGSETAGWYFGARRRFNELADKHNMDQFTLLRASAAMSPQNSPDNEFRAVSAMADAISNRRMITHPNYGRRRLTSMTPAEVDEVTKKSSSNLTESAPDFDLAGFRSGGTGKMEGWKTLTDPEYDAVGKARSTKVPMYARSFELSEPDSPLHREYLMRQYDQEQARRVRRGREADQAAGIDRPRGVPDRIDLDGLKYVGSRHSHEHEILGSKGIAVPDTWMNAIESGQQLTDTEEGSSSPAKKAASRSKATSVSMAGSTFMTKKEAERAGGKEISPGAAHGIAAIAAMQHAAEVAREPESETNIPPQMIQEMPWKFARREVAESHERVSKQLGNKPSFTRLSALRKGGLEKESELRVPNRPPSDVIETPGAFFRGFSDPINDSGIVGVSRTPSDNLRDPSPSTPSGGVHPILGRVSAEQFNESDKIAAIKKAQQSYGDSRSGGGSAWSD